MTDPATLFLCVSLLTGMQAPPVPLRWIEMPVETIVDLAVASNTPNAYRTKAFYFKPDTVWFAKGWRDRMAAHEITHHFQHHAGKPMNEAQANCVQGFQPWCDNPPKGACK